ncbi:MAG TPA: hypothetical protein VMS76_13185 [Planctomycetota bacterium]|nr:hypothetical protein [Planctomycetota bacterium]
MKPNPYRCAGAALVTLLALAGLASAQSQEDRLGAGGFDTLRIEQEDKLTVPPELAPRVWRTLRALLVDDTSFLRSIDPAFTSYWNEELFHDLYYDTPTLDLHGMRSGVRLRRRENLTDPDDRKSGRELVQIKLDGISDHPLERGEIKYEVRRPDPVTASGDDLHPLLGPVRRSHRGRLVHRLEQLGLEPRSMRPILTVRDLRQRVYVLREGQPFLSVSFDSASARIWWARAAFFEIEPELNEILFTEADAPTKAYMESVLQRIVDELHALHPEIRQDLTPKYTRSFDLLAERIPFLRLLVRLGLHGDQGLFVVGSTAAVLAWVAWRLARERLRPEPARAIGMRVRHAPRAASGRRP